LLIFFFFFLLSQPQVATQDIKEQPLSLADVDAQDDEDDEDVFPMGGYSDLGAFGDDLNDSDSDDDDEFDGQL